MDDAGNGGDSGDGRDGREHEGSACLLNYIIDCLCY